MGSIEILSLAFVSGNCFLAVKGKLGRKLSSIRRGDQRIELMVKVVAYNLNILARRKI